MCNGGRSVKYFMVYLIICNPGSHICWRGKCSPSIVKWPKAEKGTVGWRDAILVRSELCCYECACVWACADACKETELTQMVLGWLYLTSLASLLVSVIATETQRADVNHQHPAATERLPQSGESSVETLWAFWGLCRLGGALTPHEVTLGQREMGARG